MNKLAITRDVALHKNPVLIGVLGVLPGASEMYLGGPFVKQGFLRLATFLACVPLIFAFGLGLFLLPFFWLMSVINGVANGMRVARLQREAAVAQSLPDGEQR